MIDTHAEFPETGGSRVLLFGKGEQVGAVLHTCADIMTVYVSSGHRASLDTAVDYVTWRVRLNTVCSRPPTGSTESHRDAIGKSAKMDVHNHSL